MRYVLLLRQPDIFPTDHKLILLCNKMQRALSEGRLVYLSA
jgi:hypothetical protein